MVTLKILTVLFASFMLCSEAAYPSQPYLSGQSYNQIQAPQYYQSGAGNAAPGGVAQYYPQQAAGGGGYQASGYGGATVGGGGASGSQYQRGAGGQYQSAAGGQYQGAAGGQYQGAAGGQYQGAAGGQYQAGVGASVNSQLVEIIIPREVRDFKYRPTKQGYFFSYALDDGLRHSEEAIIPNAELLAMGHYDKNQRTPPAPRGKSRKLSPGLLKSAAG